MYRSIGEALYVLGPIILLWFLFILFLPLS